MGGRSSQDFYTFTQGWCHVLAAALARKGCEMVAFVQRSGNRDIVHIAAVDPDVPGYVLDIYGRRRIQDVILHYHDFVEVDVIDIDPLWIDKQIVAENLCRANVLIEIRAEEMAAEIFDGLEDPLFAAPVVTPIGLVHVGDWPTEYRDAGSGFPVEVTLDPTSWKAAFGDPDQDVWNLTKRSDVPVFVDLFALRTAPHYHTLIQILLDDGLLVIGSNHHAPFYGADGDPGGAVHMSAVDDREVLQPYPQDAYGQAPRYTPTPRLLDVWNVWFEGELPPEQVEDFAIAVLFERRAPWVDGVWVDSEIDAKQRRVPRGVIFPGRLRGWIARQGDERIIFGVLGGNRRRVRIAPRSSPRG